MRLKKPWLKTMLLAAGPLILLTGCGAPIPVLQPKGPVGQAELKLIIFPFVLMTIVALIVFAAFAWIMIKYRARPENEGYEPPEIEGNKWLETIWTIIPVIIIIAIAIPSSITTFHLEKKPVVTSTGVKTGIGFEKVSGPQLQALNKKKKPLVIDVASAEWKWIFSYPQQGIETVNYIDIPAGEPVEFQLTAIGPMNAFWIPALGGMEITMPGEDLGLWLQSNKPGTYLGHSANYSGRGFAHMTFKVYAKPWSEFNQWAKNIKQNSPKITKQEYKKLLKHDVVGTMSFSGTINPNNYNGSKDMTGMPAMRDGMSNQTDSSDSLDMRS